MKIHNDPNKIKNIKIKLNKINIRTTFKKINKY